MPDIASIASMWLMGRGEQSKREKRREMAGGTNISCSNSDYGERRCEQDELQRAVSSAIQHHEIEKETSQ